MYKKKSKERKLKVKRKNLNIIPDNPVVKENFFDGSTPLTTDFLT